jgi:hypothetical protein
MSATSRAADAAPDLHCPPPREATPRRSLQVDIRDLGHGRGLLVGTLIGKKRRRDIGLPRLVHSAALQLAGTAPEMRNATLYPVR